MYDIIIIGAGVNGAMIARTLAKYKLNILVIEKNSDVGDETSGANSAIIHSGYDPHPGTLKAELNSLGNEKYDEICNDLDVEFKRLGSLTIATNQEECDILDSLLANAKENNVEAQIIEKDELFAMEPFVTKKALKALYAPTCGIINPFELCVALMENAMDNGVKLKLNEEVVDVKENNGEYIVVTNKYSYNAKIIINCAGLFGDVINNLVSDKKVDILPRKGEYFVLDHFIEPYVTHTLFSVPSSKGKGVLVSPTTSNNFLVGPSSEFISEKDDFSTDALTLKDVLKEAYRLVDYIPTQHIIRQFSGLRAYHSSNDFIIKRVKDNFINVIGMQSPGLASAPASAKKVEDMLLEKFKFDEKEDFVSTRRKLYRLNKKTIDEKNQLIKENPLLGKIVCRCEKITEGEIVDSIHRNCGATTVKGVKKRVRPGFGKCQGGFCEAEVVKILARELNKDMKDIKMKNDNSYILLKKTKEIDYD